MTQHIALDGSTVTFDGDGLSLHRPTTSEWGVATSAGVLVFASGPLGENRRLLQFVSGVTFEDEFALTGGTLLVGQATVYEPGTFQDVGTMAAALWRGAHNEAATTSHVLDTRRLANACGELRFTDSPTGIAISRADGRPAAGGQRPVRVTKTIDEIGLVTAEALDDDHMRSLPRWNGVATSNGEMFADGHQTSPGLLVVTETAFARISPLPGSEDEAADSTTSLRLTWRAA